MPVWLHDSRLGRDPHGPQAGAVHTFGALQTVLSVQLVLQAPLPLHQ
jgi:hypothetical protein